MPELPEVETVKNTLSSLIVGKEIVDIDIFYDKIIRGINVNEFKEKLITQKITNLNRIGKYLIIELNDYALIIHLRMEGKFFYKESLDLTKHDHIVFKFSDNTFLIYNDTRKFGTMNLEKINDYNAASYLKKLGYEPGDKNLDKKYLIDKLSKKNIAIKTALLDQTIISGLGNIYVDEVLALSKILPTKKCCELKGVDFENIAVNSKVVIDKAISLGGTTIKSFTASEGVHGRFQNHLNVHTSKNCGFCNHKITKIKVNGRGTYYCEKCQK